MEKPLCSSQPAERRLAARTGSGSGSASLGFGASSAGNIAPLQPGRTRRIEGVLSKYTNLIQGWQNRYFVLDPDLGQLQYFMSEQGRSQKPRGSLPLIGASVMSSDEAPHMFIVSSANGELFKLRAVDATEQQLWMTQLQACTRRHSDSSAKMRKLKDCDEHLCVEQTQNTLDAQGSSGRTRSFSLLPHLPPSSSPVSQRHLPHHGPPSNIVTITHHKSPAAARRANNQYPERILEVKEVMIKVEGQQKSLVQSIESLPMRGSLSCLDQDLLLLKATSAATLSCLGECLNILQQSAGHNHGPPSGESNTDTLQTPVAPPDPEPAKDQGEVDCGPCPYLTDPMQLNVCKKCCDYCGLVIYIYILRGRGLQIQTGGKRQSDNVPAWTVPKSPSGERLRNGGAATLSSTEPSPTLRKTTLLQNTEDETEVISPDEEVMDSDDNTEDDLCVLDDQRSVILHLLSQLKLGMDLTRVVLPTFILEKRSLLEMYANFMAHPDLFLSISAGSTPEERMVRFVKYYMTAFHEGRKGAVAKKPYNPVLGETFHCSWEVPRDRVRPLRTETSPRTNQESDSYRVRFVAEQVSHHPPVSGFYCESAERGMCINTHIWTKSKFMGMSVGVSMVGEGVLYLRDHGEEYVFTFPSAYARSILTVPWVELGGKVTINCSKTGYSANVTFHTKPFYGGKVHRVSAEVKQNSSRMVVCKAQGEWNGTLEFIYSGGETKVIDTNKLPVIRKMIRPVEKQGQSESRRLWQHVTAALKEGNVDLATEHKHVLEEDQRSDERQRTANNMPWKPKYFNKEGDGWVYRNPLWRTH
ncbi:oxysterol-binding protein-related protein 10-like [Sinocyclocheilus anshuiensis]|uniref:oxysterol-binding protein-related protein 10-like n=1 Tax=Sinocyclocheilus anshuiensis TaxID=1608454 RepID=UPI0007B9A54C|nr:PREDICTED: oxysterol-binding protein-related protein 10-like [Sinocyclocheilus anshuiensis]